MGKSIHAKKNMLIRRLAPVCPNSRRLWKIMEHCEMMTKVEQKHFEKRKKQAGAELCQAQIKLC